MAEPGSTMLRTRADLPDERLRALDSYLREIAAELRAPGLVLDQDPSAITRYLRLPAVMMQRHLLMPAGYQPDTDLPAFATAARGSCVASVLAAERLAYGDPGMILASPGPSLSAAVILALADTAQRDRFFARMAARPVWTFFGLTEPGKGSAAMELEASLTAAPGGDGWLLSGEKIYIGNGARARIGVVFCRRAPGPWGIEAVLADTADPGWSAEPLSALGLRGALLSRLRFDNMFIPADQVLGRGLPPSRRGLHGARQTMLWFRPNVAAFALGVTQAACDYVLDQRPRLRGTGRGRLDDLADRSMRVRRLVYNVASGIDAGQPNAHRIGAAKMRAADLAVEATLLAALLLGPASLLEHPWLDKAYRDARAFEFMEGTGAIHRRGVVQGLLHDDFFSRQDGETADAAPGDTRRDT
jgi:alkylation response protein AidB-like acyl-CoA dehydrogenase